VNIRHTQHTRARVIANFSRLGRVDLACEACGVDRTTHYNWLKRFPEYAQAFDRARIEVAGMLEDEAFRRAYQGTEKPVTIAGQRELIREYDSQLLMFLLKCRNREVFGDRASFEHTGKDGDALFPQAALEEWIRKPKEK